MYKVEVYTNRSSFEHEGGRLVLCKRFLTLSFVSYTGFKTMHLPAIADGEDKSCPLKNRIRKNYRHVRKWAKRTNTDCFRIYDRDIKEYPLAIDFYAGRFCVQFFSYDRENDAPHRS